MVRARRIAAGMLTGAALALGQGPVKSTAKADAWTRLFTRTEGWTGADGIFAIPLSGYEGQDRAAGTKTLFVFSDTFLGTVDAAGKRTAGRTFYYGCGILVNTVAAGAPDPDGHVYVYGRDNLYVARVPVDAFEDFAQWRYWDGSGWNVDIAKSASLGAGGPELSVSPITRGPLKGKYLMVSCGVERTIWIRIGETPWGPFGSQTAVYQAPEWDTAGPVYIYNAKAHPSLSSNGDWLVSYNVNTSDWNLNLSRADIYHPRFFYMRLEDGPILGVPVRRGSGTVEARRGARMLFRGDGMPMVLGSGIPGVDAASVLRLDGRALLRLAGLHEAGR